MTVKMNAAAINAFMALEFPQVDGDFTVEEATEEGVKIRMNIADKHLRPGGTVSGPSMFALADVSIYFTILSQIGPEALTVTTNCSIDFMRKPAAGRDLIAHAHLHKLGRVLAVGDVLLYSEGSDKPVARASLTYSIPPVKA